MSRKIKFRVWEPLNKDMHYLNFALYENQGQVNHWVLPQEHQCCGDRNYTIMNLNNVDIMQYTGMKDKNNKEIYEGDVVKVTINNKIFNAWIISEMGSFMIANDDITYYIEDNWNDNVKCLSELAWEQEEFEDRIYCLEVVGNIKENLDLLDY